MYYSWSSANGFVTSGTTIAQFGSSSADYGYDIAIDSSDNLYLLEVLIRSMGIIIMELF